MKTRFLFSFYFLLVLFSANNVVAQITITSIHLVAQPIADRTVYFGVSDAGVSKA